MAPLPPLRDGGCALPICPFGRACHPLISDAPDCKCSPGRLRFWVVWASCPGAAAPISIHAPRAGRDCFQNNQMCFFLDFSIHAPRVGRDVNSTPRYSPKYNFNPRAPCGARQASRGRCSRAQDFNPRAPCGARPSAASARTIAVLFKSTRPVWGATSVIFYDDQGYNISIHAPRVGRDRRSRPCRCWEPRISIHAPRVGRDAPASATSEPSAAFQSTRPVWGATSPSSDDTSAAEISIHAPRVGRDPRTLLFSPFPVKFQSTRPVWGATVIRHDCPSLLKFQSTRPVWGATSYRSTITFRFQFQSTRPVWGATFLAWALTNKQINFNPRAPCGARPSYLSDQTGSGYFNPRAPCGARLSFTWDHDITFERFQSTRPVWGATSRSIFG